MQARSNAPFTGVILAGGVSRRMGQDKAGLRLGPDSMLGHMRNLLLKGGASGVVVLGRTDIDGGIADRTPHDGPAPALFDYLAAQAKGSRHLVVPVDMPALTPRHISTLAHENRWTSYHGYPLPLLAIAGSLPPRPPRRIRDFLSFCRAETLAVSKTEHRCFTNINTPADLSRMGGMPAACGQNRP